MRYFFSVLISFFTLSIALAQVEEQEVVNETASIILEDDPVQLALDSLVHYYYVKKYQETLLASPEITDSTFAPSFSDSILKGRLTDLNSFIPLDYNSKTRAFIEMYTIKKRDLVPMLLGLSQYYFPLFEETLDRKNMPMELKYLAVIESALKPRAYSRAGAVGLWQFMYATGKMHGLQVTSYMDQRRDPILSTEAACTYLQSLYKMFGDWQLAIAAYNCGPGNVRKAIRRSGGKTNFWEIYNYLPRETRGYVPAFIAANYVFGYYKEHNIHVAQIGLPEARDTVMVSNYINLSDVSKQMGMPLEALREWNPQYKKDIIPGSARQSYALILPMDKSLSFATYRDTLTKMYKQTTITRAVTPVTPSRSSTAPSGKSLVYYTVKSGDNLGYIADWYDTYVSTIKSWNGFYSSNIRVGKKIKLYVAKDKLSYYSAIDNMTFEEKKNIADHISSYQPKESTSTTTDKVKSSTDGYIYHVFGRGDTLWDLTKKYPGNSIKGIISLNKISNVRNIKVGQSIKLLKS